MRQTCTENFLILNSCAEIINIRYIVKSGPVHVACIWLALFPALFALILLMAPAYGQPEQTTISDIDNNPVAQDILQKIEQTKKWIAELEEKQSNLIAESKELEEKRLQAKTSLESDLKEWEGLWEQSDDLEVIKLEESGNLTGNKT